jgi:hypothetical protein
MVRYAYAIAYDKAGTKLATVAVARESLIQLFETMTPSAPVAVAMQRLLIPARPGLLPIAGRERSVARC